MATENPPEGDYQILALDVGQRRIGVARAQSRARLVEPLEIVAAGGGTEFVRLKELLETWQPALVIVGLPLDKRGLPGHQAGIIRDWTAAMVARTGFRGKLIYRDETLSSREASRRAKSAAAVDDLAAGILLEDYLN